MDERNETLTMHRSVRVLSEIQPATREQWERAIWKDLRGANVLGRDINNALSAVIHSSKNLVKFVEGSSLSGCCYYSLVHSLEVTHRLIAEECDEARNTEEGQQQARKRELLAWIQDSHEMHIRQVLNRLANDDVYGHEGYMIWEELDHLIQHGLRTP